MTLTSTQNFIQFSTTNVSLGDIVPEDIQNELMSWRDVFTLGYFSIGDIANELVDRSAMLGLPVTNKDVYHAVGRFCGKSARTVRYYAEMASFFTQEIRQEYDMLPFTHFRLARTFGQRSLEVLELAKANPHFSEEGLRREFTTESVLSERFYLSTLEDINENFVRPIVSQSVTEQARSVLSSRLRVANVIGDLVEELRGLAGELRLKRDTAMRLVGALDEIKRCLPEILAAIDQRD